MVDKDTEEGAIRNSKDKRADGVGWFWRWDGGNNG